MVSFFFFFYSVIVCVLFKPLAKVAAIFSDRIKRQIENRDGIIQSDRLIELAAIRRRFSKCTLFFCSSAGEYEQAKPVISRLQVKGEFCFVLFFSKSGYEFAQAKSDPISYAISPWDDLWSWGKLLSAICPSQIVIVRHEFWPGFLEVARKWGKIFVLDAVPPAMLGREFYAKSWLSASFKKFLLKRANATVLTVDSDGDDYFRRLLGSSPETVRQIGDTKYDRVREQMIELSNSNDLEALFSFRRRFVKDSESILIIGSAHAPDLDLVLEALRIAAIGNIKILVVPHDISPSNIFQMANILDKSGYSYEVFSEVDVNCDDVLKVKAVVVDSIGKLSKLYRIADFAFVGGAVHSKIHNVLEPAVCGLPMACGSRYENSQEAKLLYKKGLLFPAKDALELSGIFSRMIVNEQSLRSKIQEEVTRMCGASDRFVSISREFL